MKAAFYKGRKRLFNRLTAWWLRGPYSHCELIVGTDLQGRSICASSSFMDGGVRIKAMHLDVEHWDLVEVGEMLGMPEPWRFDPCSLWAALSRKATTTTTTEGAHA